MTTPATSMLRRKWLVLNQNPGISESKNQKNAPLKDRLFLSKTLVLFENSSLPARSASSNAKPPDRVQADRAAGSSLPRYLKHSLPSVAAVTIGGIRIRVTVAGSHSEAEARSGDAESGSRNDDCRHVRPDRITITVRPTPSGTVAIATTMAMSAVAHRMCIGRFCPQRCSQKAHRNQNRRHQDPFHDFAPCISNPTLQNNDLLILSICFDHNDTGKMQAACQMPFRRFRIHRNSQNHKNLSTRVEFHPSVPAGVQTVSFPHSSTSL
jgi:hypothetical protein